MLISLVEYFNQIAVMERGDAEIEQHVVDPFENHQKLKAKRMKKRCIDRKKKHYERSGELAEKQYRREYRLYDRYTYLGEIWESNRRCLFKKEAEDGMREYRSVIFKKDILKKRILDEMEASWEEYEYKNRSWFDYLDRLHIHKEQVEEVAWQWYKSLGNHNDESAEFNVDTLSAVEYNALKDFLCA